MYRGYGIEEQGENMAKVASIKGSVINELAEDIAKYEAYGRDLRLFVTLSGSILSFSKWSVAPDSDYEHRYVIAVDDAADYPDALACASEGLIESMSASHGLSKLWYHERTHRDQIMFRMTRSV
jgi:hypothetical protein